jgi:hypothetical protein
MEGVVVAAAAAAAATADVIVERWTLLIHITNIPRVQTLPRTPSQTRDFRGSECPKKRR